MAAPITWVTESELSIADDLTMAANISSPTPTETQVALDQRLAVVAADVVAADPTVAAAAAGAVGAEVASRDLIDGSDERADKLTSDSRIGTNAWTDKYGRASLHDRPDGVVVAGAGIETPSAGRTLAGSPYEGLYDPISRRFAQSATEVGTGLIPMVTLQEWGERAGWGTGGTTDTYKRDAHLLTGTGSNSGTGFVSTQDAMHFRVPFRPFCNYYDFDVCIQNKNIRTGTTYGAVSITGIYVGEHLMPLGELTGNFSGAPTQLSGALTIPADGSVTRITVDRSKYVMNGHTDQLLAIGYNSVTPGQQNQSGPSVSFQSAYPDEVGQATPTHALTKGKYAPLRVWLEPRISSRIPVVAWFTDSHGLASNADNPLYDSFVVRHALANGYFPRMYSIHGSTIATWLNVGDERWTQWASLPATDAAVVQLGSNDIFNDVDSVATMQANFGTLVGLVRTYISKQVFGATWLPRNSTATTATAEAKRVAMSDWLRGLPNGMLEVLDYAAAVSYAHRAVSAIATSATAVLTVTVGDASLFRVGDFVNVVTAPSTVTIANRQVTALDTTANTVTVSGGAFDVTSGQLLSRSGDVDARYLSGDVVHLTTAGQNRLAERTSARLGAYLAPIAA